MEYKLKVRKIITYYKKVENIFGEILLKLKSEFDKIRIKNNTKYFCIGRNKTGTTSLEKAFKELGFVVGNQREAEFLIDDYFKNNLTPIINYCKSAEVFQDVPFSSSEIYKDIDKVYPNSKFILTVRDNSEQWYNSITKFHAKLFGNGNDTTWDDLKKAKYVYEGWIYKLMMDQYDLKEDDNPYDKEKLIFHYEKYNLDVMDYFKDRPQDLLIINLSDKDAYVKFCDFIDVEAKETSFPWENKTDEIKR